MGRFDTTRPWKRPGTAATKDYIVANATMQYLGHSDHSGRALRQRYVCPRRLMSTLAGFAHLTL